MTHDETEGGRERDDPTAARDRQPGDADAVRATASDDGSGSPQLIDLDVPSDLLADVEPVEDVYLVRVSLADGSDRRVAQRLLDALDGRLTVVGSTLERFDPGDPRVDALVETDCERDALASALADIDAIEGVVVADVDALDPETSGGEPDAPTPEADDSLAIYRLDDHLVVTDDFGAFAERVADAVPHEDAEARRLARSAREDVDALDDDLSEFGRWVDGRFDEVDAALDDAADAETVAELEARIEREVTARDDLEAARNDIDAIQAEVETVRETAEAAQAVAEDAVADSLTHLEARLDEEVTSHEELERIFAPAAPRVDDPEEYHDTIHGVVQEMDRELRRSHALREASLLQRVRWMLTGELPTLPGEDDDEPDDSDADD